MTSRGVEFKVAIHIDQTVISQQNSLFNILIIILVLVLLVAFSSSFTANVTKLVIEPLEKMMSTLRNSAILMIKSLKMVESAQAEEDKEKAETKDESSDEDLNDEALETAMLEQMVAKLSRIVQHIVPSNAPIADSNIDKVRGSVCCCGGEGGDWKVAARMR